MTGKYLEEVPAGSRFATDQFKESRNALFNTPEGKVKLEKVKKLKEIADRLQVPLAQLALAWALKNPHVSQISHLEKFKSMNLKLKLKIFIHIFYSFFLGFHNFVGSKQLFTTPRKLGVFVCR